MNNQINTTNKNTTPKIRATQSQLQHLLARHNGQITTIRPFLDGYQTTVQIGDTNVLIKNHRLTYASTGNLELTVLDRNNKPIYNHILHQKFKSDDVIKNITIKSLDRIINKYLAGDLTKM
jgi:hypothetical protein